MKLTRTPIFALMQVVVLVAVNLAVGRMIFDGEPWRLAGIGPIGVLVELGLVVLIHNRRRRGRYAFWTGFEAGALLGIWSFLHVPCA